MYAVKKLSKIRNSILTEEPSFSVMQLLVVAGATLDKNKYGKIDKSKIYGIK